MTKKKPVILVDGSSYLFRAYHALPPLTNSKGRPTGAIYGVLNMLRKLLQDYRPQYIGIIFDSKEKTFRHKLYPDYKATREVMPEALSEQVEPLLTAIKALGLPLVIQPGVEADDVIGTLAQRLAKEGQSVVISTGDKDLTQLVNDRIILINTMTHSSFSRSEVEEKFGVPPERMVDYLALIGDAVDNVPGVPKVGPKTAAKWLQQYGSLDQLIARADEIKGKVGENLRAHLEKLPLFRRLVTVRCDLDLPITLADLTPQPADHPKLVELFTELEFKKWLQEEEAEFPVKKTAGDLSPAYELVLTKEDFRRWLQELKRAPYFAFDTETTHLDAMRAKLVGLSFAVSPGEAAYVPLEHDYEGAPAQLDKQWVLAELRPLLENPKQIVVGQNLKYDYKVLWREGLTVTAQMEDTLLLSYVLDPSQNRHDLSTLALKYLNKKTIQYTEVAGKGSKQKPFNAVALEQAGAYASEDADIALQLHQAFEPLFKDVPEMKRVVTEIEWPLMPVLARMELCGVLIDVKQLQRQSRELEKSIQKLKKQIYQEVGCEFNIDSTKQLRHVLFDQLKLPAVKKTVGGQASTAEEVLQELSIDYLVPQWILEYRRFRKLQNTYTDTLPHQVNPETGRVHTHYLQTGTSTGRLASKEPNLQNIPARTEEGRKIRRAFIAEEGYSLVSADYSQIELRIMAHLSRDPGLISAFERGLDIHAATASEVFGVKLSQVTPEQRRRAKAINFGLLYGMSSFGLGKQLGIGRQEAQQYIDIYFSRYPGIQVYMESARRLAVEQGYVETLFKRRLYVPDIRSRNASQRRAAERSAINAPLQGTAADLIKKAMLLVDRWLQQKKVNARMILQVHDELVFEIADEDLHETTLQGIRQCMEKTATLSVPLTVDLGVGKNWDEAH